MYEDDEEDEITETIACDCGERKYLNREKFDDVGKGNAQGSEIICARCGVNLNGLIQRLYKGMGRTT